MLPSIESIKQQRLKINMTQKELANLVGVSTSMINQIESGRSAPSYNTAKKIFEVLEKQERANAKVGDNALELCSQKIVKLKPTNTLAEAIIKLKKEKISQIPIFNGDTVVGTISEPVIVSHINEPTFNKKMKIEDIMESKPPIVEFDTPAEVLVPLVKYSKCILVSKGPKIIGIITATDLLREIE